MLEFTLALLLIAFSGLVGYTQGVESGQTKLCRDQFHGEIRDGKCVSVAVAPITLSGQPNEQK
jgi:hypothetical protein